MKNKFLILLLIAIMPAFIYGGYWVAKHGSYFFFYEDMVKQTIQETVKAEALKQNL